MGTEGQTDMTKLIHGFRSFAKAPNSGTLCQFLRHCLGMPLCSKPSFKIILFLKHGFTNPVRQHFVLWRLILVRPQYGTFLQASGA
jgi:hypothetical protein